jgi:hypothetical protein
MKDNNKSSKIIRWLARIYGSISLLFLIFMVGAHVIGAISGTNDGAGFNSTQELISFLFFPISIMIGLGLAWKWDGLGGLITILGIVGFHIFRPDLISDPMIDGLAAPGIIFIIYWLINFNFRHT